VRQSLTDLHYVVLLVFAAEWIALAEEVAERLGLHAGLVHRLCDDLARAGHLTLQREQ